MDDWYAEPAGRFALRAQQQLLLRYLAPWPRAGRSLLEVNCGAGHFLPLLRECGFDVTAVEIRPHLREAAARLGTHTEILAAADDHLPFENDAFDGVVLHLVSDCTEATGNAVAEAFRVAAARLAVTFWNAASLPFLLQRLRGLRPAWPDPAIAWWRVWRALKALHGGFPGGGGVLAGPEGSWNSRSSLACCNGPLPWPAPCAWGVLHLNMAPPRFVTPLPLRLGHARLAQPEPALECGAKQRAASAAGPDTP